MFHSFCWMRLKTAGVVIGLVGSVCSLFMLIFLIITLTDMVTIYELLSSSIPTEAVIAAITVLLSVLLVINVVNLVASALLIAGIIKERHLMLAPWLVNSILALVICSIILLILLVVVFHNPGTIIFGVFVQFFCMVLHMFITYAVYSLYVQLQSSRMSQNFMQSKEPQILPAQKS